MADSYDTLYEAHLKDIPTEGVVPVYRCVRGNVILKPTTPLVGGVQHVCPACSRVVEQTWKEYRNLRALRGPVLDVTCPDG